jgi:hypothetical protein
LSGKGTVNLSELKNFFVLLFLKFAELLIVL